MPGPEKQKPRERPVGERIIGRSSKLARPGAVRAAGVEWGILDRADTLAGQAYSNIKTALMNGLLAPGERVSMRQIAEAFGISLTPARDALARLAAERALEVDPRRTFRVPVLKRSDYRELLTIRILLEGFATKTAVPGMDGPAVDTLEGLNARFAEAIERGSAKQSLELNRRFHLTIYQAAGMPELFGIIEGLWVRIGPSLNLLHPEYQRGGRGLHNHRAALDAIRVGDAEGAKQAIERDLVQGADYILNILKD